MMVIELEDLNRGTKFLRKGARDLKDASEVAFAALESLLKSKAAGASVSEQELNTVRLIAYSAKARADKMDHLNVMIRKRNEQ